MFENIRNQTYKLILHLQLWKTCKIQMFIFVDYVIIIKLNYPELFILFYYKVTTNCASV